MTGIDTSEEMIKTAKSAFNNINFLCGYTSDLTQFKNFSIVTSIMAFQFIENIEKTFQDINNKLESGGIFVFAVFNPSFIKECLRNKTFFKDFDSFERPKKGIFNLDSNKIPVFIRTAEEYNNQLQKLDCEPLLEKYPPFTEEFLQKYPISNLIYESEYLILGYRKN